MPSFRQMELLCHQARGNYVSCEEVEEEGENNHGICIYPEEVCDGIPQCPNATDESLDKCQNYFSSAADLQCDRPNIVNGMTVPTWAIRCNGIIECSNGEDETNCQLSSIVLYAVLLPGMVVLFVISFCVLWRTNLHNYDPNEETLDLAKLSFEEDEQDLKYQMIMFQSKPNREDINRSYFQAILAKNEGSFSNALNLMKQTLHPNVTKTVLEDVDSPNSRMYQVASQFQKLTKK